MVTAREEVINICSLLDSDPVDLKIILQVISSQP